jgi:hypothetical protein
VSGVFISYRDDDAQLWPLLLRDQLAAEYGDSLVFLDRNTLKTGPWRQQIERALSGCTVVLVLIGPQWLSASDADGQPRLGKPDDFHRREIELALAGSATVIPVLLSGAEMPRHQDLPASVAGLADLQARLLSPDHSRAGVETLLSDIDRADPNLAATRSARKPKRWRQLLRPAGTVLLLLLLTPVATVVLLVGLQVGFGLTFRSEEISTLALIVFIMLIAVWRLQVRLRQR